MAECPESTVVARPEAIVGVGASAGGLEAIEAFFKAMPLDSGMGFVVIQHLSPDYKSLMVELLSRKTRLSVQRAEDGVFVKPDNIYLIPPKTNLTIFHGKLLLKEQKQREGINLPVDIFFRSLAEDQGARAVGVVLSGTGSDGTRGVRAIKEWGGLVMVQDEASAKFDGMPRAAASTGVADFILPPGEMPSQLLACLRHPYASRQERQQKEMADESGITRLFSMLRAKTKVDFTYYKPSTITRRIERRIAVTQSADLDAYVQYAEETPAEIAALYRELLIGVTSFFRDPEIMAKVKNTILPDLLRQSVEQELRFWVAGCSTGEEAYTLAILIREVMETLGMARDVKIFATDIDRDAIARAGSGIYPESIAADLQPSLLTKYFYCHGERYQVARSIREMVVFAQHNLVNDPPFTRVDMVSCRNLLIYLQSNLQQKALEMFGFSLRPGGVLLLGSSESVGEMQDSFEAIDRKARLFRCLGKTQIRPRLGGRGVGSESGVNVAGPLSRYERSSLTDKRQQDRLLPRLLETLATSYVSLAVVVNEQMEILHTLGDPRGVFTLPSGRAVYDISKMVNRELAIPLATGIQKVFRTGDDLVYTNVRLPDQAGGRSTLRLRMCPLLGRKNDESLVLIFFEELAKSATSDEIASTEYDVDEETSQRLHDLEQELQFTRENLQATIEELETSNEELQATNEELLASNEELQSTNEELQSTNEELYTVNTEYQNKIIELTEARNDVDNLLLSFRIGTLLLDEDLCIRRYSPQAVEVFHILESDIGRPLNHLTHRLLDFSPVDMALEVQRTNEPSEHEAQGEDGRWYMVRTLPYRIGPQAVSGVVFTLIDITPIRDVRERLESSRQTGADIVRHMPSGLFVYDVTEGGELLLRSGNPYAAALTGLNIEEMLGKSFSELWPGKRGEELQEFFLQAYYSKKPVYAPEVEYQDKKLRGVFHIHAFRLPGNRLAVGFDDITERVKAQRELRRIEWLLAEKPHTGEEYHIQPYGDLSALNENGRIRSAVGASVLMDIVADYLDLLETSAAVYEADGQYAFGIFSSGWCRFADHASFRLCDTDDLSGALCSGKWLCHESCWTKASKRSIATGEPVDIACEGGLRIYALPICSGDEIIGSINFGYGDPPRDPAEIRMIAERFHVDKQELLDCAASYETRPPFIVALAKKRLAASARLIGEIVARKRSQEALQESEKQHRYFHKLLADAEKTARMGSWTWDVASDSVTWSANLFHLFGRNPDEGAPSFAEHDSLYTPGSMIQLRDAVKEALEKGQPYEILLKAVCSDGSIKDVVARGHVEQKDDGSVSRLYGSLQERF
ncbi:MAG: chemotaxis protein CheB [Desulfopila sp.]|jgi:two-component system CheB/CheR fusion protein|nr:chemotaxis protein CheB [Desulfopila sp.]